MRKFILFFLLLFSIYPVLKGQDFPSPPPGKAQVIFARPTITAFVVRFRLFDSSRYLGLIGAGGYLSYDFSPGKHIFWGQAKNRDFLEADLLPDKVYLITVEPMMGGLQARIKLLPFDPEYKKAEKVKQNFIKIMSRGKQQKADSQENIEQQAQLDQAIDKGLRRYQKLKSKHRSITQLTQDMHL